MRDVSSARVSTASGGGESSGVCAWSGGRTGEIPLPLARPLRVFMEMRRRHGAAKTCQKNGGEEGGGGKHATRPPQHNRQKRQNTEENEECKKTIICAM